MSHDELRKLEHARRRALWEIARFHPGDPKAADALAILDDLDAQDRSGTPSTVEPLELDQVRDSVPVQDHSCGIDIVLERDIPNLGENASFRRASDQPELLMGFTLRTGINSWQGGKLRCGT